MTINPEVLVIQHLNDSELGVSAYADVPADRPKRFITVERTGGSRDEHFDRPTLAIQVWAGSRAVASGLAYDTQRTLWDLIDHPAVGHIHYGTLYHWPDPDSRHERYQFTVDLLVKT